MAGFLQSFNWDLFLSYGWAGNERPDEGDRAWVADFFEVLNERLRTPLGTRPNVFIDRDGAHAGYLGDRLTQALDASALFLIVISPGSCRLNSWCHMEAARFWDRARRVGSASGMILSPEDRMFKVVMSPVQREMEPPLLAGVAGRDLFDQLPGSSNPVARPADWRNLSSNVDTNLRLLVDELARELKKISEIESKPAAASGKRIFLGASSSGLNRERLRRLRRELLIEGHEVRSASPLPIETEENLLLRTEEALQDTNLAVFAIGEPWVAPNGWNTNAAALQLEAAFRKSAGNVQFSVYAWEDPNSPKRDEQCLIRIKPNSRDQHIRGDQDFEYLESNVRARLQELARNALLEAIATPGEGRTVCIEYREEDANLAVQLRDALRLKQIQVQFAIPTPQRGTLINRIMKKNQSRYYPAADGLVVFFGDGDYEWVSDVCFAMKEYVHPGRAVIVLGPPRERPPGKEGFDQPGFLSMKCFDSLVDPAFEAWIDQLPKGR